MDSSNWNFRRLLMSIILCGMGIFLLYAIAFAQTGIVVTERTEKASDTESLSSPSEEQNIHGTESSPEDDANDQKKGDWLDNTQETISSKVSGLTRWFDNFFSDSEREDKRDYTHGRINVGLWWDEKDELDFPADFRVNFSLPNMERRINAFLGKINEDDFLTGSSPGFEALPPVFRDLAQENDEWLAGLGYSPIKNKRNRLDFDVGANVSLDRLAPFAKARYRYNLFIGEQMLTRFRPTGYWKSDDGFGTSLRIDWDYVLSADFLIRWANSGNLSETTLGMDWWSEFNLFQHFGKEKGIVYIAKIDGETDNPVEIKDYGFGAVYRQQLYKQWLFGSLATSLTWPKDTPEDAREPGFGIGMSVEMRFGERPGDFEE